jgi:Flp pilus assembly protein TadG
VVNMFAISSTAGAREVRMTSSANARRLPGCLRMRDEEGAALVEFAVVFPVLMIIVFGLFSLGLLLNQYLQLTNAVAIGGQVLAVDRANSLTPCADAMTAIENAAPFLTPAQMTFNFSLNGTAFGPYTGGGSTSSCTSSSNSTGAAADLVQGKPVQVTVQYPCTLGVYLNTNIVPGCQLTAQITEITQ